MQKVLVSASHFDTLCRDAYQLLEANGYQVLFDPARSFPAYTTQELENHPDREDIVAALIGMDDFRDEGKFKALPNLKAVAKFGVGVDNIDGKLAGAALDAFEVEPLPAGTPILKCENIVLTPHTGAETKESYYNVSMTTVQDILRVLKGEKPVHCVNP